MEWTEGAALWLALLLMLFLSLCCVCAVCQINPLLICNCAWCKVFDCWGCCGLGPHSDERVKAKIVSTSDEEQGERKTAKEDADEYYRWKQEQEKNQQQRGQTKPVAPQQPIVLESSRRTNKTLSDNILPGRCQVGGRIGRGAQQRGSIENLWKLPAPPRQTQR